MATVSPWSTTSTGPVAVAGAACADAKPQMGTADGRPGSTTVPGLAHSAQDAAVPVIVHPVCASGPCGAAGPAGTAAGTASARPAETGAVRGRWVDGAAAWAAAGTASESVAAAVKAAPRSAMGNGIVLGSLPVTARGSRRADRCG
jgi:hypothetical protein